MYIERIFGARGEIAQYDHFSGKRVMVWAVIRERFKGDVDSPEGMRYMFGLGDGHEVVGLVIHAGEVVLADEVEGFKGYKE